MKSILLFLILALKIFPQDLSVPDIDYQPQNLEEAIAQLDVVYPDSIKTKITEMDENEFIKNTHFTTGRFIRNEWLYDRFFGFNIGDSDLKEQLIEMGIPTNDDMSGLILRTYYRHLTKQELKVEQQIIEIQNYYINLNK